MALSKWQRVVVLVSKRAVIITLEPLLKLAYSVCRSLDDPIFVFFEKGSLFYGRHSNELALMHFLLKICSKMVSMNPNSSWNSCIWWVSNILCSFLMAQLAKNSVLKWQWLVLNHKLPWPISIRLYDQNCKSCSRVVIYDYKAFPNLTVCAIYSDFAIFSQ